MMRKVTMNLPVPPPVILHFINHVSTCSRTGSEAGCTAAPEHHHMEEGVIKGLATTYQGHHPLHGKEV